MSKALPPQKVLSQLEDQKVHGLSLRLAGLAARREAILCEMEEADMHLADVGKQRELSGRDGATALQLSSLEAERRREQERKSRLAQMLETIAAEENELKAEILVCMGKSQAYTRLLEHEEKLQRKHALRVEQQSIDDLMAHRRTGSR